MRITSHKDILIHIVKKIYKKEDTLKKYTIYNNIKITKSTSYI